MWVCRQSLQLQYPKSTDDLAHGGEGDVLNTVVKRSFAGVVMPLKDALDDAALIDDLKNLVRVKQPVIFVDLGIYVLMNKKIRRRRKGCQLCLQLLGVRQKGVLPIRRAGGVVRAVFMVARIQKDQIPSVNAKILRRLDSEGRVELFGRQREGVVISHQGDRRDTAVLYDACDLG